MTAYVLIDLDLHWNKNIPPDFGLLAIRFSDAYFTRWVQGSYRLTTIADAVSSVVSEQERVQMMDDAIIDLRAYSGGDADAVGPLFLDDTLTHTELSLINWGRLEILHGRDVRFVCLSSKGTLWVDFASHGAKKDPVSETPPS